MLPSEMRFPSLKGGNEHIDDRDCIFYMDAVTYMIPEGWSERKRSLPVVNLKIPHFVEERRFGHMTKTDTISHWTNLEVSMEEFLK